MTSMRFSSLSLTLQTSLLISLLLLGEITFVALLSWQLYEADKEITREAHLKEVLRNSQKLVFLLSDYEHSLEDWANTQDASLEQLSNSYEEKITNTSSWLSKNTSDLNLKDHIHKMTVLQGKMFRIVHKAKERLKKIDNKTQMMAFVGAVFKHVLRQREEWESCSINLLNDAESLLKTYPEIESNRRGQLEKLCWIGIACNIILVLALSVYFVRAIISRLLIMADNTRRLTAKLPMNPIVKGSDEIAKLDLAMHEMSNAIDEAQRERQAFLAMVSHELRTPLNSIRGTIEILSMGVAGPITESSSAILDKSDREIDHLISKINDLLDLEKMEAGKLSLQCSNVYLDFCVSKSIEQVKELAKSNSVLIVQNETNTELFVDADRITQIIRILLCNAIQHSPTGAEIKIQFSETDSDITIEVVDSGSGVPDSLRNQLFDRFRKLAGTDESIAKGMGLPIAKKIAEAHQGVIGFKDNITGGSTFYFTLPKRVHT